MKSRDTRATAAHRQAVAAAPRTEAASALALPAAARARDDAPRLDVGRSPRVQAQRRTVQALFGSAVRRESEEGAAAVAQLAPASQGGGVTQLLEDADVEKFVAMVRWILEMNRHDAADAEVLLARARDIAVEASSMADARNRMQGLLDAADERRRAASSGRERLDEGSRDATSSAPKGGDEIDRLLDGVGMGLREDNHERARRLITLVAKRVGCEAAQLHLTSSSGISLTVIPPSGGTVYQMFVADEPYAAIEAFHASKVQDKQHHIESATGFGSHRKVKGRTEDFPVARHMAGIVGFEPALRTVLFERIQPLNALFSGSEDGAERLKAFVQKNALKLVWDLHKAVQGLKAAGFSQGDVRLDNVGIKDGRFVLFDYDKVQPSSNTTSAKDLKTLNESLQAMGVGLGAEIMRELDKVMGESIQDKLDHLEKLAIE